MGKNRENRSWVCIESIFIAEKVPAEFYEILYTVSTFVQKNAYAKYCI